jgi:hypothetical protein
MNIFNTASPIAISNSKHLVLQKPRSSTWIYLSITPYIVSFSRLRTPRPTNSFGPSRKWRPWLCCTTLFRCSPASSWLRFAHWNEPLRSILQTSWAL